MTKPTTKALFHALLVGCALIELRQSKSDFRKMVCGAWAGFHAVATGLHVIEKE